MFFELDDFFLDHLNNNANGLVLWIRSQDGNKKTSTRPSTLYESWPGEKAPTKCCRSHVTLQASTMTTTIYMVAYPHPFLEPRERIFPYRVDPQTYRPDLLTKLYNEYPNHTEDLKAATIWKVPPLLSITRCPPQLALQAGDLSIAEVCSDSMQGVCDWINRQDESAIISRFTPLVDYFPGDPHEGSPKKVDIVVVTQDSTS